MKRNCQQCNKDFVFRACPTDINTGRGKYCSSQCKFESRRTLPKIFVCETCSKKFPNLQGKIRRFCSHKCYSNTLYGKPPSNKGKPMSQKQVISMTGKNHWNWKGGKPRCEVCDKLLKYGSTYCLSHWKKENHPNWKGGTTEIQEKIRTSYKYVQWRREVLIRDKRKCIDCGTGWNKGWGTNTNLNVDHIKPFSEILLKNKIKTLEEAYSCSQLWDKENARTLCIKCHKETETFGFKQFQVRGTDKIIEKRIYG